MQKTVISIICIALLFSVTPSFSEMKTFIREYSYDAGEMDSKISCRAIALEQVKRLLLEELGTYVENVTVVKNSQLDRDQITTLTAGVVQTTILDESWDGKRYWLQAQITADPDEVAAAIDQLKDKQQMVADLEEARQEAADALAEVDTLKTALADATADKVTQTDYDEAIQQLQATDWFERGQFYVTAGNYEEAIQAYDKVTNLKPNDAKGYSNRGITYVLLGNYQRAVGDFDRAIKLNPKNTNFYEHRRIANKMLTAPNQLTPREKSFFERRSTNRLEQIPRAQAQEKNRLQQLRNGQVKKPQGLRQEQTRRVVIEQKKSQFKAKQQREQVQKQKKIEQPKRKKDTEGKSDKKGEEVKRER